MFVSKKEYESGESASPKGLKQSLFEIFNSQSISQLLRLERKKKHLQKQQQELNQQTVLKQNPSFSQLNPKHNCSLNKANLSIPNNSLNKLSSSLPIHKQNCNTSLPKHNTSLTNYNISKNKYKASLSKHNINRPKKNLSLRKINSYLPKINSQRRLNTKQHSLASNKARKKVSNQPTRDNYFSKTLHLIEPRLGRTPKNCQKQERLKAQNKQRDCTQNKKSYEKTPKKGRAEGKELGWRLRRMLIKSVCAGARQVLLKNDYLVIYFESVKRKLIEFQFHVRKNCQLLVQLDKGNLQCQSISEHYPLLHEKDSISLISSVQAIDFGKPMDCFPALRVNITVEKEACGAKQHLVINRLIKVPYSCLNFIEENVERPRGLRKSQLTYKTSLSSLPADFNTIEQLQSVFSTLSIQSEERLTRYQHKKKQLLKCTTSKNYIFSQRQKWRQNVFNFKQPQLLREC